MGNLRRLYVGIDVHKKTHKVAMLPHAGIARSSAAWRQMTFMDIETSSEGFHNLETSLKGLCDDPSEVVIAVDHTGGHYCEALVYFLQSRGYSVFNVEPAAMKEARDRLLAEENKSDKIDAASAAYLLYLRDAHGLSFRISSVPYELGSQASVLAKLIIEREQHNKRLVQVTNRLHQLLASVFPEGETNYPLALLRISRLYPTPADICCSNGLSGIKWLNEDNRRAICRLAGDSVGVPGEQYRDLIKYLAEQRAAERERRDAIGGLISSRVAAHPYGPIMLSFPCMGPMAAAAIISVAKDINNWPSDRKFKKALGLYSTLKQSGVSPGRARMGRGGSRHTRRLLFEVVLRSLRKSIDDNDFKDYYARQVSHNKPARKALVATMGKLAEIVYHCVRSGEHYQYSGVYGNHLRPPKQPDGLPPDNDDDQTEITIH